METIEKATAGDVKRYLRDALKFVLPQTEYGYSYAYNVDYDADKKEVYYTVEDYTTGVYFEKTFMREYTLNGVTVTLGDNVTEVKKETIYTPVESVDERTESTVSTPEEVVYSEGAIMRGVKKCLSKLGIGEKEKEEHILKQFNEEKMIEYGPLYCPADTPDYEGDGMTQEDINKMVDDVNKGIKDGSIKPNLFHKVNTNAFHFVEAFTNPWPDTEINGVEIKKGQPVLVTQYTNPKAWELRKSGVLKGLSIGAIGRREKANG